MSASPARHDWSPVIIALVSVGASVLLSRIATRQKDRELDLRTAETTKTFALRERELETTLRRRVREEERAELSRRLTTFYGPLNQRLQLALALHHKLLEGNADERVRGSFRTVIALIDPAQRARLDANDMALIGELVATTREVRTLIMTAEGYLEPGRLLTTLTAAAAHFQVLDLAYRAVITGAPDRFATSVYPGELDQLLEHEIRRVRAEITRLSADDDASATRRSRADPPAEHASTGDGPGPRAHSGSVLAADPGVVPAPAPAAGGPNGRVTRS